MPALDHGFKEISLRAGRALARIAGLECDGWSPVESTLQKTTERLADRAFRTKIDKVECVVYMEFITAWETDDLWSIQAKAALLSEKERLPTVCLLFILRKKGFVSQNGRWELRVGGRVTQQLWFVEILLWELEPPEWWESQTYLLPLYPLCRHNKSEREAIRHAAALIHQHASGSFQEANLIALLTIFGEFASPELGVTKMLGDEIVKNSSLYRQAFAEGELDTYRGLLLKLVTNRFPEQDLAKVTDQIQRVNDKQRLEALFESAQACKTFDEFRKKLKPVRKKKS